MLTAEVACYHGAVGSEEDNLRNAIDTIEFCGSLVAVDELWPYDALFLFGRLEIFQLIPYEDTQYGETFVMILLMQLEKVGNLTTAGTAPACPHIHEQKSTST